MEMGSGVQNLNRARRMSEETCRKPAFRSVLTCPRPRGRGLLLMHSGLLNSGLRAEAGRRLLLNSEWVWEPSFVPPNNLNQGSKNLPKIPPLSPAFPARVLSVSRVQQTSVYRIPQTDF